MTEQYEYNFKFIFVGDPGVGKSTLLQCYTQPSSKSTTYEPTIGVDLGLKTIYNIRSNKKIRLQLWDTAGHEKFRTITQNYYRRAACILLMYDTSRPETWDSIRTDWYPEIIQTFESYEENPYMVLVGNKIDIKPQKVQSAIPRLWAKKREMGFIEISAQASTHVESLFSQATDKVMQRIIKRQQYFDKPLVHDQIVTLQQPLVQSPRLRCMSWFCPRPG